MAVARPARPTTQTSMITRVDLAARADGRPDARGLGHEVPLVVQLRSVMEV
jgi:hypothetical protein